MWAAGSSLRSFQLLGLSGTFRSESRGRRNSLAQSPESDRQLTPAEESSPSFILVPKNTHTRTREDTSEPHHTYLSGTNSKVIIVDVDGGDGVPHWELPCWRFRSSFSSWCRTCRLTGFLNLCFLLLRCLMGSLGGSHQDMSPH